MSHAITRRTAAVALLMVGLSTAMPARGRDPQPPREATIQSESKARLILQSHISSKLSEPGDIITATLAEPIYGEGEMVLPRGLKLPFVSRNGQTVVVKYLDDTPAIPVSATDLH